MANSKWPEVQSKLMLVEAWCRDGLTDEQIYKKLEISKQTFYTYKDEHLDFFDALKKGKEVVDTEVENALLKRAKGYSYEEITTEIEESTLGQKRKVRKVTKEVFPDVAAAIIWLKNRRPDKWRENVPQHLPNDDESENLFEALTEAVNRNEV